MSSYDISGLSCCLDLVSILGIILALWDPKAGIIRDQSCFGLGIFGLSWCLILVSLFRYHFGIMRFKSRHHQRTELPRFWHLWSLMMPTFGSHDAKKMPKPQNWWKPFILRFLLKIKFRNYHAGPNIAIFLLMELKWTESQNIVN